MTQYEEDHDGKQRAVGGDTFSMIVSFGPTLEARVLMAQGNASQKTSPHRHDQLSLHSERNMREPWLSREQVKKNTVLRDALH